MFLYNDSTQEQKKKKKIWDRVCWKNIQNSKNLMQYRALEWLRFTNIKLGVFREYQNTQTILKKKTMGQNHFKKLSKFQKFQ